MNNKKRDRKPSFKKHISFSLFAGMITGMFISLTISIILSFFYNDNFQKLSFINLLLFVLGNIGLLNLLGSFLLLCLTFIIRLTFKKLLPDRKIFAFVLSGLSSLQIFFWSGFYINANLLRYSGELISYLADFSVFVISILLFFVMYRIIPAYESIKRIYKISIFIFLPLVIAGFFVSNPFSYNSLVSGGETNIERNYDFQGNYIGSEKDIRAEKYNVLLYSIDTLRSDSLASYGNRRVTSPNIDSLAKEGVIFQNTLAQSSWTLPSHMTMITSLYPSVHGCMSGVRWTKTIEALNDYWITLPEILKYFGYSTAAFTDGDLLGPKYNFDQGFDISEDYGGGIKNVSKRVINWLDKNDSQKPFFIFMHNYDVHRYRPPSQFKKMFVDDYDGKLIKLELKDNLLLERLLVSNAFYHLSDDDIKYIRDLYDAEIYYTDSVFGEVIDYLKKKNIYDNTIIIVTSDHGEEFWEHGGTGHGWSLYQHQLKVPLVIKSPTFTESNVKIEDWVGIIDIAPTILDMLNIPVPNDFQGFSLLPLIENGIQREQLYIAEASHLGNQIAIIHNRYSLLFNQYPPVGENIFNVKRFIFNWRHILNFSENMLFNLREDPGETKNIIKINQALADELTNIALDRIERNLSIRIQNVVDERIDMDQKTIDHLKSLGYIQ